MRSSIIILCTGLLLSGCAIAMPASEIIMFESETKSQKNEDLIQQNIHQDNDDIYSYSAYQERSSIFQKFTFPFQKAYLSFSLRPQLQNELPYAKEKFSGFIEEKKQEPDIEDDDFQIAGP